MALGKESHMNYKWIGGLLIILGCGGFGFTLAANHRWEETCIRQLLAALDYMGCELQYRMTPLPDLCRSAAAQCKGLIGQVLRGISEELDRQISPDAESCMHAAMARLDPIPETTRKNLKLLGATLGRFDLTGQLSGLESVRESCRCDLARLIDNRDARLRSYQTLGLCAGAALAILLI